MKNEFEFTKYYSLIVHVMLFNAIYNPIIPFASLFTIILLIITYFLLKVYINNLIKIYFIKIKKFKII
jgi:hypothetical protein